MIDAGSVLSDLGRLCFYQLKPVSTLTALGWSLLHHHPVDICGIFLAWNGGGGTEKRRGGRERKGARIGGEGRGEGREGEEERTVHLFNTCHHALLLYKCYKFHKYSTAKALAMVIPASYPSLVLVSAC